MSKRNPREKGGQRALNRECATAYGKRNKEALQQSLVKLFPVDAETSTMLPPQSAHVYGEHAVTAQPFLCPEVHT